MREKAILVIATAYKIFKTQSRETRKKCNENDVNVLTAAKTPQCNNLIRQLTTMQCNQLFAQENASNFSRILQKNQTHLTESY